jgi:Rod binding domain-containing protein
MTSPVGGPVIDRALPEAAKLKQVGREFESLLIAEMLKHVRESGSGGWLGGGEDSAGETAVGYAEEWLARALASGGGLGLAAMIEKSLSGASRPEAAPRAASNSTR